MNNRWRLKYILIVLIFMLLAPFPLNNYRQREFTFKLPPLAITEERAYVESKESESIIKKRTKKKDAGIKPEKSIPIRVEIPQRMEVSALKVNIQLINLDSISKDMNDLALQNKGELEIRHFHIPRVEYHSRVKDFILPAGLIVVGAIASQTKNYRDFVNLPRPNGKRTVTHMDDILEYAIAPSLFVFDAIGKEKHDPVDQFFLMAISSGLTLLQVRNLKSYLKEDRPDGGTNSFPSGHTAAAFMGAQLIYKEFKDSNPWIAYSGYVMAGTVGALRIVNNRHWVSDVVAGAGMGMVSVELSYLLYFPLRNVIADETNNLFGKYFIVTPVIAPGALGLQVNVSF